MIAEQASPVSLLSSTLNSTADGILVINAEGKVILFNERFLDLWRIPLELLALRDDQRLLDHVMQQLVEPEVFIKKVVELYATPHAESFDTLYFVDGRVFERYSCPQEIDRAIIGRVWSFRDITRQVQAEREREQLRTTMIETQQAALRELSTPLIPVARGVLIMPLIGTIDDERASEIMEALLDGVASHRAHTVILDITGVQVVDTQVANRSFRRTSGA
ncbi:MAG: PAS domain-containing protein, partial [Chloroflexaceae bacterium]|nr:PAS domain-containing protein [Chloroflexaceae bacterium]